jgi:hypothetical protein
MLFPAKARLSDDHLYHYCEGARAIITTQILDSIAILQSPRSSESSQGAAQFIARVPDVDAPPISPYDSVTHGDEPSYAPYFI